MGYFRRILAVSGPFLAAILPAQILAQESAEPLAATIDPLNSVAASTEASAAVRLERPTGVVLSIGHDTIAGAPRFADRATSGSGTATVRFSAIRVRGASTSTADFASLPVREGRLTSGFGYRMNPVTQRRAFHHGIDLAVASGTPVLATADGRVAFSGWAGDYGVLVVIDHGNGVVTRMGHLSAISVRAGDAVAAGDVIGRAGATGRATGPHVHYEIRIDGGSVDPLSATS